MKKLLSLLLVLSMLISLPTAFAAAEEQVTLKIAYFGTAYVMDENGNDVLADIYSDFTREYPNIAVEIVYIPNSDWSDYTTKVQAMYASGEAPDLVYCPGETENVFFEYNMVQPLTPFLEKNPEWLPEYEADVSEALRKLAIHDGEYYGFLQLWENDVLWINNEIFRQAGADIPSGNWTWQEFEAACALIEKNTDAYAFFLPDTYYINTGWLYSYGTGYLNADHTDIAFDSDASKELMQFYSDAVQRGWASADWTNLDYAAEFINGNVAMISAGLWNVYSLANENFTDVSVAYIPTKYSDLQTSAWASMQVTAATEHYDEAALLAVWSGDEHFNRRYFTEVCSNIPARTSINVAESYPFEFDGLELFLEAYPNTTGMQNPACFADLETIWRACVSSVISGLKDVETAVNDAAAEMRMVADF